MVPSSNSPNARDYKANNREYNMYYRTKYQVSCLFKFQLTNYTQRKLKRILAPEYRYKIRDFRVLSTNDRPSFPACVDLGSGQPFLASILGLPIQGEQQKGKQRESWKYQKEGRKEGQGSIYQLDLCLQDSVLSLRIHCMIFKLVLSPPPIPLHLPHIPLCLSPHSAAFFTLFSVSHGG